MEADQSWLFKLEGRWKGSQSLYLTSDSAAAAGELHGSFAERLNGNVLDFDYKHSIEAKTYNGIFLITRLPDDRNRFEAAWIDEFHTGYEIMKFSGGLHDDRLILEGRYEYNGEYWKWVIEMFLKDDQIKIKHYNHPPGKKRYLGVDINLSKAE